MASIGPALTKTPTRATIWAFFSYPKGPSPFVELNLETWHRNAPEMRVILVNDSNVHQYVPDLPEEYFRLGSDAAKSDLLRAALTYHHGGLYMDTDFMLLKPVAGILKRLEDHDVVTYIDRGDNASGSCGTNEFSSNFFAARQANAFSKAWWDTIKAKLAHRCSRKAWEGKRQLCCHAHGTAAEAAEASKTTCQVPWASIEHLRVPLLAKAKASLAESSALSVSESSLREVRMFCLAGNESLTPHLNGEVFWQPWDTLRGVTSSAIHPGNGVPSSAYESRFQCFRDNSSLDLECSNGTWGASKRVMRNFFGRPAYHLFYATMQKSGMWAASKMDILNMDWLVSEMYKRALGLMD